MITLTLKVAHGGGEREESVVAEPQPQEQYPRTAIGLRKET